MQRLYTTQFNAINSLYWLKNKCGGLEATLYALREDHVRAPLSQQKSSALPRLPPARYCHFNQVVAFLLNYEQTLTLFYSLILELVKTPFTFY